MLQTHKYSFFLSISFLWRKLSQEDLNTPRYRNSTVLLCHFFITFIKLSSIISSVFSFSCDYYWSSIKTSRCWNSTVPACQIYIAHIGIISNYNSCVSFDLWLTLLQDTSILNFYGISIYSVFIYLAVHSYW